ncbi:MAG: hypothetical protein ACRES5_27805, partial [Pseudomonas sp.]
RRRVELFSGANGYLFPDPGCNKTRNGRVLVCFVLDAAGLCTPGCQYFVIDVRQQGQPESWP